MGGRGCGGGYGGGGSGCGYGGSWADGLKQGVDDGSEGSEVSYWEVEVRTRNGTQLRFINTITNT
jgi:hypothetical protein